MKKCFDHVWSFWRIIDQMAPFWELKSITGLNGLIKTSPFFSKICYNRVEYHEKMHFEHAWLFRLESA